jgi:tetratricopeptide (TPR) repeat protein
MHNQSFQDISQFENQLSALSKKRQQESERHYRMGFQILETAFRQGFQNLSLFEQACTEFIHAIRHNRADVRPYLSLSYVFSLVNNYPNAWKYAKAALELAPENKVVLNWEKTLQAQEKKAALKKQAPQVLNPPNQMILEPTPQNLQTVYSNLQRFLIEQVKHVMELKAPEPSLDHTLLNELNHSMLIFQKKAEQIESQFIWLEKHKNIDDLRKLYTPFDTNLRRYREAIGVAMSLSEMLENCQNLGQEVAVLREKIKQLKDFNSIPQISEELEYFLDQCDYLADNIEYLDSQGYDLSLVEKAYEKLSNDVAYCQDQLDNTIELFNKLRRQRRAEMPPEPSTAGIKNLLQKLPDASLPMLAERLWFLMPINPVEKIHLGLQTFCLKPDKEKMVVIVKELINSLNLGCSKEEEASIYGLLAIIFYSYRKPLLAVEFLDYAESLCKELPYSKRLKELLVTFSRQRLSLKTTIKKPVLQGVTRLLSTTTLPVDQVAESLRLLLLHQPNTGSTSLYLEALELLCDYCMNPERNRLLAAADRLLMALASQEQVAEVYVLLGCIFFAIAKPLLAQEYIGFSQAMDTELAEAKFVLTRVSHLKMQELSTSAVPSQAPLSKVVSGNKQIHKPSASIAINTLQNKNLNLTDLAKKSNQLLQSSIEFPQNYRPIQLLAAFASKPSPSTWGEAIHCINQSIESDQAQAEDYALMGYLLYMCGKPLLLLEYLDYAQSLQPHSKVVQHLQTRFRKRSA